MTQPRFMSMINDKYERFSDGSTRRIGYPRRRIRKNMRMKRTSHPSALITKGAMGRRNA